jgi:hypothetical protein
MINPAPLAPLNKPLTDQLHHHIRAPGKVIKPGHPFDVALQGAVITAAHLTGLVQGDPQSHHLGPLRITLRRAFFS